VTTLLHEDPSWGGIGRSVLVLCALWWAWASYAWLTNTVDAEDGLVLGAMLVAMAAMFIGALAVPEAFGEHRLIFSVAFIVVLLAFIGLFALAGKAEADLLRAVLRTGRITLAGALLIFAAGFVPSGIRPVLDGALARSAAIVASWARYAEGVDEHGAPIEIVDRRREEVMALAGADDPLIFIESRDLFGDLAESERFKDAYLGALRSLRDRGARATLAAFAAEQ
jgi:hypothetical protein